MPCGCGAARRGRGERTGRERERKTNNETNRTPVPAGAPSAAIPIVFGSSGPYDNTFRPLVSFCMTTTLYTDRTVPSVGVRFAGRNASDNYSYCSTYISVYGASSVPYGRHAYNGKRAQRSILVSRCQLSKYKIHHGRVRAVALHRKRPFPRSRGDVNGSPEFAALQQLFIFRGLISSEDDGGGVGVATGSTASASIRSRSTRSGRPTVPTTVPATV